MKVQRANQITSFYEAKECWMTHVGPVTLDFGCTDATELAKPVLRAVWRRPVSLTVMISRRDAAIALDVPMEMAQRHGIPKRLSEAELGEILDNPPAWLIQSRANRTGKRPVWVHLECAVCGYEEAARPKKWWPEFTYVVCGHHAPSEVPPARPGLVRSEFDGVGTRFVGIADVAVPD